MIKLSHERDSIMEQISYLGNDADLEKQVRKLQL